jgi:UDP-N-acetylmuramate--L-alanine ligase/UDP-N-acetylenolpyruvoylglucosamine reductase
MVPLNSAQIGQLLETASPGSTVYLVGIGGCGVSGLAHLLLDLGFRVVGSDLAANEETRQLADRGATIHLGHHAEQLAAAHPILVAYSSAIRLDNPQLQAAERLQIPLARRALLLAALVHRQRGVCVAGMHGKTTTSALLAFALENLGANPSYAIGALVPQLARHARLSVASENLFIAEADESDGTLSEFRPQHAIVLNVDAEHLDFYANLDAICREFANFAQQTHDTLVFCADDPRLAELFARRPGAISYGFHPLANYRLVVTSAASGFEVWHSGQKLGEFTLRLIGEKNISNAGSVIALLHRLGYAPEQIARAIADFTGAARRQQELFSDARFRVFDDYGHHPAEIQATLQAFKSLGVRRLLVAFQPHRFTRTQALMSEFATCFGQADLLWVADIYAASEPEIPGVTSERLVEAIRAAQREIRSGKVVHPHPGPLPQERERDGRHQLPSSVSPRPNISGSSTPPQQFDVTAGPTADDVPPSPGGEGRGEGGPNQPPPSSPQAQLVEHIPSLDGLRRAVRAAMLPGDVVLFLGAGDITKAAHELAAELREESVSSNEQLLAELTASLSPESIVRRDEPLAKRTTLRVGGKADLYVEPASEDDLSRLLKFCARHQLKFTLLGRGSNLLIKDGGIRGVVICLNHPNFSRLEITGDKLSCGAGVKLKAVSVEARRAGLAGLEFLEGIPGSLGGSMRMNAGAMGSWLFDVVEKIRFMDYAGVAHERVASEVNVEYRGCPLFKNHIALGAVLKGQPTAAETVAARMQQYSSKRWESQPKEPSAGCIFKNPKTIPAGKLIDELGLKGTRVGGAMVSDVHGNFIVNADNATASDVLNLIEVVKQRAKSARGIELETEVEILGEG